MSRSSSPWSCCYAHAHSHVGGAKAPVAYNVHVMVLHTRPLPQAPHVDEPCRYICQASAASSPRLCAAGLKSHLPPSRVGEPHPRPSHPTHLAVESQQVLAAGSLAPSRDACAPSVSLPGPAPAPGQGSTRAAAAATAATSFSLYQLSVTRKHPASKVASYCAGGDNRRVALPKRSSDPCIVPATRNPERQAEMEALKQSLKSRASTSSWFQRRAAPRNRLRRRAERTDSRPVANFPIYGTGGSVLSASSAVQCSTKYCKFLYSKTIKGIASPEDNALQRAAASRAAPPTCPFTSARPCRSRSMPAGQGRSGCFEFANASQP